MPLARGAREVCASLRDGLTSAVMAGQGGLALEAWLAARRCLGEDAADAEAMVRLRAGGYAPNQFRASEAPSIPISPSPSPSPSSTTRKPVT
jgi:hypothetical protein